MFKLLIGVLFLIFTFHRTLTYLHIFQQEEYDGKRFLKWVVGKHAYDKKISFYIIFLYALSFIPFTNSIDYIFLGLGLLYATYKERNPLKIVKKPLVLTKRAKRILAITILIVGAILCSISSFIDTILVWVLYVHFIPLALVLSAFLLSPVENRINKKLKTEAMEKISRLNPYIIGITGSYGKTSVKHILGHILQSFSPTLITPGSVNTEMGITRIIREQLQSYHHYFIVEMGAYNVGSIERLCALTPPKLSIITAIGHAHRERFKTLESTTHAKFEIATATLENKGHVIVDQRVLEQNYAKKFIDQHKEGFSICGRKSDLSAKNIKQTSNGLTFDIILGSEIYPASVSVYGRHHVDNIILSFAMALHLGMEPQDIITTLSTLPQIKHRLEVKKQTRYTLIDDAYNSNPEGFSSALRLLNDLADDKGQRILVTPGIIELGDDHEKVHTVLGKLAAQTVDTALIVCSERIESFVKAYESNANTKQHLIRVTSFQDAQKWLDQNAQPCDIVLFENDLVDLYETKLNL